MFWSQNSRTSEHKLFLEVVNLLILDLNKVLCEQRLLYFVKWILNKLWLYEVQLSCLNIEVKFSLHLFDLFVQDFVDFKLIDIKLQIVRYLLNRVDWPFVCGEAIYVPVSSSQVVIKAMLYFVLELNVFPINKLPDDLEISC